MAVKLDPEVFLDSAYVIALAQSTDAHHVKALQLAELLRAQRTFIVTTRAVLLEVGNALARLRTRVAAVNLVDSLERSPMLRLAPLSEDLASRGWNLFRERRDKEWSWTDCISFVAMQEAGLRQALTSDQHFHQAGFEALLRL